MKLTRRELLEFIGSSSFTDEMNKKQADELRRKKLSDELEEKKLQNELQQQKRFDLNTETRYHSPSVLDTLLYKNKNPYTVSRNSAPVLTQKIRGVPEDTSKTWVDSMAGAKSVIKPQQINY